MEQTDDGQKLVIKSSNSLERILKTIPEFYDKKEMFHK